MMKSSQSLRMRKEVIGYGKDFKRNYLPRPLPVLQPAGYPNSRRLTSYYSVTFTKPSTHPAPSNSISGTPTCWNSPKSGKKINNERLRVMQFLRFQKAADGTYFAALKPLYNVISLVIPYLQDRFADQKWLLYDLKREYGYYHDQFNHHRGTL